MNPWGSIEIAALGIEPPIVRFRLARGLILLTAQVNGPALLKAGVCDAVIYGEDGERVADIKLGINATQQVRRGEHVDLEAAIQLGTVSPGPAIDMRHGEL